MDELAKTGRRAIGECPVREIDLFLCGDVMTGRGIDQALPHPGNPALYEPYVRDAREYVRLAERANGPIPQPTGFEYIWGDALRALEEAGSDVRIVNLETSITSSDRAWPGKGIHYRMHPENVESLTVARIDCCCLANNHVLDSGYAGLAETLKTLDRVGIARVGAGMNAADATTPAALDVPGKGRVLVFSLGSTSSGIPRNWAATREQPGVGLLSDLSGETAERVARQVREAKREGDVAVVSIHWGGNWGYEVPYEQIYFAHCLVEGGIDIVHGHSSHHPKAIEVYHDRLILYGCGDFLDDYEGISGYEEFRDDLRLMYLVRIDPRRDPDLRERGLREVRLIPMQARRFRLNRASEADGSWLCQLLNRLGGPFGTQVELERDNSMTLRWG